MAKEKIGIYGGTFDPIHFGHLNLAVELMEHHQLTEVWFLPTNQNPHKPDQPMTAAYDRLKMTQLAVTDIPHFDVIDIEVTQQPPVYTVDTLQIFLKEKTKQQQLYLMFGDDALPNFHRWKNPEMIVELVPLLIGKRQCNGKILSTEAAPALHQAVEKGMTETSVLEISATNIRERLQQGLYCGHLIPASVLAYIHEQKLYLS